MSEHLEGSACCLDPDHLQYLEVRGVDRKTATAAELRSVTASEAESLLGIPNVSSDGLWIPYPGITPLYGRLRMFNQDLRFLAPPDRPVPIYLPAGFAPAAEESIAVVESPIKALSMQAQGLSAIGLGGTGTTLTTGSDRCLNDSWHAVVLKNRPVRLLFDSNTASNSNVARDQARLAQALERAGALVLIAVLPHNDRGEPWGPDDYLRAKGVDALKDILLRARPANPVEFVKGLLAGSKKLPADKAAELLCDRLFLQSVIENQATRTALRPLFPSARDFDANLKKEVEQSKAQSANGKQNIEGKPTYVVENGGYMISSSSERLSSFTAYCVEEITTDDGAERTKSFLLQATAADGTLWPQIRVSAADLNSRNWPLDKLGAGARVEAISRAPEHLLAAILSGSTPAQRTCFAHMGVRKIDGQPAFLHAGGAIGHDGGEAVETVLDGGLERYRFPDTSENLPEAMRVALSFINVAPTTITIPLLLAAFRAPVCELKPFDATIHLVGASGSLKSTLAALIMCFYGDFSHDSLPASWNDSAAALEYVLFLAKDVPVVIDDFSPRSAGPKDDMRLKAAIVLRSIGNHSPRKRMTRNGASRPAHPPRALVITSGEDTPTEASILARMLLIPIHRNDVDLKLLTQIQKRSKLLPQVMRAYLEWLLSHYDSLATWIPEVFETWRTKFQSSAQHLRAPGAAANLAIGAELFARFAFDVKAMTEEESKKFIALVEESLLDLMQGQRAEQDQTDPVRQFLSCLLELVATGRFRFATSNQMDPSEGGRVLGWKDKDHLFLFAETACQEVTAAMREASETMPYTRSTLLKRLKERGLLQVEESGHNTVKRIWGPDQREVRVAKLSWSAIHDLLGIDAKGSDRIDSQLRQYDGTGVGQMRIRGEIPGFSGVVPTKSGEIKN